MRARMALVVSGIRCDLHEVDFKDKPQAMLEVSPKGTVPVLVTINDEVIDESLDIMYWALAQNDPENMLIAHSKVLINQNDGEFKAALDRYKYPNRFAEEGCTNAREWGLEFLQQLEDVLSLSNYLVGNKISVADIAIFPFVRQFMNVDKAWFDTQPLPALQKWLAHHLESDLFLHIFEKHKESTYSLL
jgi:glutathione S-transferase